MAQQIKFGTDGWRAIIAKDFTVENVARVTEATGKWLKQQSAQPSIVLDTTVGLVANCLCKPLPLF